MKYLKGRLNFVNYAAETTHPDFSPTDEEVNKVDKKGLNQYSNNNLPWSNNINQGCIFKVGPSNIQSFQHYSEALPQQDKTTMFKDTFNQSM